MVNLKPYFRYNAFTQRLKMLEKGYIAARDALQMESQRIRLKADEYEESLANGGEWIGEYEDGHLLWDQSQAYEYEMSSIHDALFEIRKAFVVALYHHWEQSAAAWKGSYAKHDQLAKYCSEEGYGPSPDLNAVQCLANYIKHGPNSRTDWLGRLKVRYPSFLSQTQGSIFGLSEDDLHKVAAAIFESGPKAPNIEAKLQ